MDILNTKELHELSAEQIKQLRLPDYAMLESKTGEYNKASFMYIYPDKDHIDPTEKYYPIIIFANKHSLPAIDKGQPFDTRHECSLYCDKQNRVLGHDKHSMFMILESIRLEELLRKKLAERGELKIVSDFSIRETNGNKYILFEKGNGILTGSSIVSALNQGLAAIKREKEKPNTKDIVTTIKEVKNSLSRRNQDW